MNKVDADMLERARRLRRLTAAAVHDATPAERDRRMQVHLAQARGPAANALLLRKMSASLTRAHRAAQTEMPPMTDDPLVDVTLAVVSVLQASGVSYAITGSIASGVYGEPITSQDVDIAVRMTAEQAADVARRLPPRFYRSEPALIAAARFRTMANLIDTETGLKVDLSVLPAQPFYDGVFQRRQAVAFGPDGPSLDLVSPEDVVLMKLAWRKDTGSRKQWENARSVVRVRGAGLDWKYLFEQAKQLGVTDDLVALRDEAGV